MNALPVIEKILFTNTGTYNDMAYRPYAAYVNEGSLRQMQEATRGGTNLGASGLAGVAGDIIRPVSEAQGIVTIPNSWDTPRLRFLMTVRHSPFAGGEVIQTLTGYTDYIGVTALHGKAHLDPNMRLFFNNSILSRRTIYDTPYGQQPIQTITDASQLLMGSYEPSFQSINHLQHAMRPEDVFANLSASSHMGGSQLIDTRTAFSNGMKKSRRSNAISSNYLSRVMTAHQRVMNANDDNEDQSALMAEAANQVRESLVTQDPLLGALIRISSSLVEGSSITFGELCQLSPGLDHDARTKVAMQTGVHATALPQRGQMMDWGGISNETLFSTILSQAIPAIMLDLMLTKIAFKATNQVIGGMGFDVRLGGAMSFADGVDLGPYMAEFIRRLQMEVLPDLTKNNQIDINITGQFDIAGDSTIDISVAGGPVHSYVVPSFCDALMAPVIANNAMSLSSMATSVDMLATALEVNHMGPTQAAYPTLTPMDLNYGNPGAL